MAVQNWAKPDYATAEIAVWWDMKDCPIPEAYDACRVRPNLERAFKKLGYSGPLSITAYADQTKTPDHVLRGLSSTGVAVAHSRPGDVCSFMFSDILEWQKHNPPPATMMLISDHVNDVLSWDLARLQQRTYYNLFRAYSSEFVYSSRLATSAVWLWDSLLDHSAADNETTTARALYYCKSCSYDCQRLSKFKKHLSSRKHIVIDAFHSPNRELDPAKPKYATAKIAVWWDMKDCLIPKNYDAGQVGPGLERAFKSLGYSGPVSITAYADQTQTPDHVLQGLTSTGVAVAHSRPGDVCSFMFSDILAWRRLNPPPATMMLISDHVDDVLSWDLARLQQHTYYNLFRAYSCKSVYGSVLATSAEWLWDSLLNYSSATDNETTSALIDSSPLYYCKSCSWGCQSLSKFKKHLCSRKHIVIEASYSSNRQLDPVTRTWGRNYRAKSEFATANIGVWWDMDDCPIPDGYDYEAHLLRPCLEAAFESLGYSGSVSITAFGDQKLTRDHLHLLQGLSSTGVDVVHSIPERTVSCIFNNILEWRNRNPPPASMMIISNRVDEAFSHVLVHDQQHALYNLFLAYSFRPFKMSALVTSAEWVLDTLFADFSETRIQCEREKSTGMFYCRMCDGDDIEGFDHFMVHLASKEHAQQEACIPSYILSKRLHQSLLEASDLDYETTSALLSSASYYCKSCSGLCQSLRTFKKHFFCQKHVLEEAFHSSNRKVDPEIRRRRNYRAEPKYATANIGVWWDMDDCPIPEGYEARQVRPCLEAAFKSLGYSGSVSITAFGDQKLTHDHLHLLQGLSSTGVDVVHSIPEWTSNRIDSDILEWRDRNPPPATMMVISNQVDEDLSYVVEDDQQFAVYNLFLAYSFRPFKMPALITSAEWLWDTLFAETRIQCEREKSTGMFYCRMCFGDDFEGFDRFKEHLASKEHRQQESSFYRDMEYSRHREQLWVEVRTFPESEPYVWKSTQKQQRGPKSQTRKKK